MFHVSFCHDLGLAISFRMSKILSVRRTSHHPIDPSIVKDFRMMIYNDSQIAIEEGLLTET